MFPRLRLDGFAQARWLVLGQLSGSISFAAD